MKKVYTLIFVMGFILAINFLISCKSSPKVYASEIEFQSKSNVLIEAYSGEVILSNNEKEHLPIASICKVMTLLLAFESIDKGEIKLDQNVIVSENASNMGGSQVFLEANGIYKVNELLKSITVASANDASVAIAELICGNEDDFVEKMNEKASQLGMLDTRFVNCTGLPCAGQYSCALDVAKMFSKLIKHKEYFNYSKIWMDEIKHPKDRITQISNTNKLIKFYNGCDSGKTGYTSEAGHCLVASAIRNNLRLICVTLSAKDSKSRFAETSNAFNYGFNNFENRTVLSSQQSLDIPVNVEKGKKASLEIYPEENVYILSKKNQKRGFDISFTPNNKIVAPIQKGETVGIIDIFENNIKIKSINAIAGENIDRKTYFDNIVDIAQNWNI